jgi:DNA-binding SARP family transcriptional activator
VEAAREASEAALLDDDPRAAVRTCRVGLTIDRYDDQLWRLLIEARRRAGDPGAADRDRRDYESMLAELGLSAEPSVSAT